MGSIPVDGWGMGWSCPVRAHTAMENGGMGEILMTFILT